MEAYYTYPMLPSQINYFTSQQTGQLMGLELDLALQADVAGYEGEVIGTDESVRGTIVLDDFYDLK